MKPTPSLFETAAEYEAKRASAHPIAHIQGDTSTGEEHEVTKFQVRTFYRIIPKVRIGVFI